MIQRPIIFALFVVLTAAACKTYTTTLEQSVAKADETSALGALHSIAVAERTYSLTNDGEYGTLKQLAEGGFLDSRFSSDKPLKDYVVTLVVTPKEPGGQPGSYKCNADPENIAERAGRHLYIDSTSEGIHVNDTQPATAADKLLQ